VRECVWEELGLRGTFDCTAILALTKAEIRTDGTKLAVSCGTGDLKIG
jgi:hypothetical protein